MRKVLKWIGIVLGGLVGLIVLAAAGLYLSTSLRLNKTYGITPEPVTIPTDVASLEIGKHWTDIHCTGCHGEDLGGTNMFSDPSIGSINAPNLTPGQGGAGTEFTDSDWVLAIRHGVDPHKGRALLVMPSSDYYYLSDADLGAMIAYLKTVPPVDKDWDEPPYQLTPMARILAALGAFGEFNSAETIDHAGPRPQAPEPAVSMAYGEYLVKTFGCRTCHGAELAGGKDPNPQAPPAPNITPGGELGVWSEADFITAAHTRVSKFMPWEGLAKMTDDELKAIWLYLQSVPARETTAR